MTDTETALRENDRSLTNLEQIACELEWLRQAIPEQDDHSGLLERVQGIVDILEEAHEEDEFRRQRIAELEEGFVRIQNIEFARAPDDDEYGYLSCNAEGFNGALRECQSIAASLLNAESVREGDKS